MTRPTRRLRTRLLVAMVAIAFGTLVVAAAGAAAIARRFLGGGTDIARDVSGSSARGPTQRQLSGGGSGAPGRTGGV